jgi:hypothetical protein
MLPSSAGLSSGSDNRRPVKPLKQLRERRWPIGVVSTAMQHSRSASNGQSAALGQIDPKTTAQGIALQECFAAYAPTIFTGGHTLARSR